MFDTMKVAKKIKEARIAQNMTQMNLADEMEVSYQAVSNWERGSSMPDISKLEQLCTVLNISLEELLGTNASTSTITKIIQNENNESETPVTMEEIGDILPLLPPAEAKKLVEDTVEDSTEEGIHLEAIIGMAPFLDEAYLEELVKKANVKSLHEIVGLAPFLSEKALDTLVRNAPVSDMSGVLALAPFLSNETLTYLTTDISINNINELVPFAPFLEDKALDNLVDQCIANGKAGHEALGGLYPFLSDRSLKKLAEYYMKNADFNAVKSISPFC